MEDEEGGWAAFLVEGTMILKVQDSGRGNLRKHTCYNDTLMTS